MTKSAPAWRPPHAYVPGQTPRHAEDLFDDFKYSGETPTAAEIEDAVAWRMGLALLADGYFWECHEVLESAWLAAAPNSAERTLTQGVIQLANAALKQRMGQPRAAQRLTAISDKLVAEAFGRNSTRLLGLSRDELGEMRRRALGED